MASGVIGCTAFRLYKACSGNTVILMDTDSRLKLDFALQEPRSTNVSYPNSNRPWRLVL